MIGGLGFDHPAWLWTLAVLPLLVLLAVRAERRRRRDLARLLSTRLAPLLTAGASTVLRQARLALVILALAAGIVALAGPHAGYALREMQTKGRDVILAVDVSRSMLANDLQPSRIVRAQLLADDIVRQLSGDRIGVVAFAGSAFLQAPLTVDHGAVLESVQALDTEVIPRGGSNIAQAVRTAVEAFGKGESSHRALIILSDGEELDADALPAVREAAEAGIRFYTVGIGTVNGSVIPVKGEDGGTAFVKDAGGNFVTSRLDESRLQEIAQAGGGSYYNLSTHSGAGAEIAAGISSMEASDTGSEVTREAITRYQWPLGLAVAALLTALLLPERSRRKALRKTLGLAVTALILVPRLTLATENPYTAYASGDFDKAYEGFAGQSKQSASPRDAFNAGTAALKVNRYDEAIAQLGAARSSKDATVRARASYNLAAALAGKAAAQSDPSAAIPLVKDAIEQFRHAEEDSSIKEDATFNREAAESWLKQLEDLQKQQQQEKRNQQDKKNQQDQQQKSDQQQQDQQQGQSDRDSQEGQDEQDGQQQGSGEDQDQQQGKSEGRDKQQDGANQGEGGEERRESGDQGSGSEADQQPTPAPTPVPGQSADTLEGDMKQRQPAEQNGQQPEGNDTAEVRSEQAVQDGQMTSGQARAILESLRGDERRVLLLDQEQQQQQPTNKDW